MWRLDNTGNAAFVGKTLFTAIGANELDPPTRSHGISHDLEVVDPDTNFSARLWMHCYEQAHFFDCKLISDYAYWRVVQVVFEPIQKLFF